MIWVRQQLIRTYTSPLMTRKCPCAITHFKPPKLRMSKETIYSRSTRTYGTTTYNKFKQPVCPKTVLIHPLIIPCTLQAMRLTTPTCPARSQRRPTGSERPTPKSVKQTANQVSMLALFSTINALKSILKPRKKQ